GVKIPENDFSGNVKFEGAPKEGSATFFDFKAEGKVNLVNAIKEQIDKLGGLGKPAPKSNISAAEATFSESFRFPEDYKTGPVKMGRSISFNVSGEVLEGPDAGKGSMESSQTLFVEIKYLGNEGGDSKVPDKKDPETGGDKFNVTLTSVTATRDEY